MAGWYVGLQEAEFEFVFLLPVELIFIMVSLEVRLQCYSEPFLLLSFAIYYIPYTVLFSQFLLLHSTAFRAKCLLKRAKGTVLELGPGGGDQMYHYTVSNITIMYGTEPNGFLHPRLQHKATEAGIKSYICIEAGAQPRSLLPALKATGLITSTTGSLPEEGIFDTITTVKSLCSTPQDQLRETVAVIQALLKPGGEFLFFEHLGNNDDMTTRTYAWVVDLVWPALMGGCRLDGKLDRVVLGMGG